MNVRAGEGDRGGGAAVVLAMLALAALVAAASWWFLVRRPAEQAARAEAARTAEAAAEAGVREKRRELFGDAALAPGVVFRASGLGYRILEPGSGPAPGPASTVRIRYIGRSRDGRVFDETREPAEFRLAGLVPGMSAGVQVLRPGGRIELFVPPSLGYGARPVAGLPPNSGLRFEVTLVEVLP
jgi:FKBP-type peptidyl-prolyl cis-trans isomerase FkpA